MVLFLHSDTLAILMEQVGAHCILIIHLLIDSYLAKSPSISISHTHTLMFLIFMDTFFNGLIIFSDPANKLIQLERRC